MNRRDFLKYASLTPLAGMIPSVLASNPNLSINSQNKKILLLIELKGGNDGLSTLIPKGNKEYEKLRPTLAIRPPENMHLDKGLYLNPYLKDIKYLWNKGDMAWIQGVGYPNSDRSHFHSIDVWNTASTNSKDASGWLTKSGLPNSPNILNGIIVGDDRMGPFAGKNGRAVAMENPRTFLRQTKYLNRDQYRAPNDSLAHLLSTQNQIISAADLLTSRLNQSPRRYARFPNSAFGRNLEQVTRLITSGVHLPVFKVTLEGFDTHAGQKDIHNNLMHHLGGGLAAFHKAMAAARLWDNVLVMTYSEFGRRVAENSSQGTDHGSASVQLVLGGRVNKGIYGKAPSLTHLDDGDLIPNIDFRQVYATISQRWWRRSNPWSKRYHPITFV